MLLQYRRPLQSRLMGERKTGTGGKAVEICHTCVTGFIPRGEGPSGTGHSGNRDVTSISYIPIPLREKP